MKKIDEKLTLSTDTASLAVFDPNQLTQYVEDDCDWWACDFDLIPEVKTGKVSLVGLGADGIYDLRVTTESLTNIEKAYAQELIKNTGFETSSGHVCIAAGEGLPGGGEQGDLSNKIELPNGKYDLEIYRIDTEKAELDGHETPAEFVIIVKSRTGDFKNLRQEPRFEFSSEYLFASKLRKKYTIEVGLQLEASAVPIICPGSDLFKDDFLVIDADDKWPKGYSEYTVLLDDKSKLCPQDKFVFKILSVDEKTQTIKAEVVKVDKLNRLTKKVKKLLEFFL